MRTTFSKKLSYLQAIFNRLTMVPGRVPRINTNFIVNSAYVTNSSLPSQSLDNNR